MKKCADYFQAENGVREFRNISVATKCTRISGSSLVQRCLEVRDKEVMQMHIKFRASFFVAVIITHACKLLNIKGRFDCFLCEERLYSSSLICLVRSPFFSAREFVCTVVSLEFVSIKLKIWYLHGNMSLSAWTLRFWYLWNCHAYVAASSLMFVDVLVVRGGSLACSPYSVPWMARSWSSWRHCGCSRNSEKAVSCPTCSWPYNSALQVFQ